jgi:pimeloyl-ACP methyl ester carboxylesterase
VEKLTMAGHSWGAMLAMAYAQEHPNRVAGLLLLDTGPVDQSGFTIEIANVRARLTPEDRAALQQAKEEAQIDAVEQKAYFAEIGNVGRLRGRVFQPANPSGMSPFDRTSGLALLSSMSFRG